jgi:hypothetical protein
MQKFGLANQGIKPHVMKFSIKPIAIVLLVTASFVSLAFFPAKTSLSKTKITASQPKIQVAICLM